MGASQKQELRSGQTNRANPSFMATNALRKAWNAISRLRLKDPINHFTKVNSWRVARREDPRLTRQRIGG